MRSARKKPRRKPAKRDAAILAKLDELIAEVRAMRAWPTYPPVSVPSVWYPAPPPSTTWIGTEPYASPWGTTTCETTGGTN